MATADFQARLNRIEKQGPSGLVTPGAVENTGFSRRNYLKAVKPKRTIKRRGINMKAVVLALLFGSVAGVIFDRFVGVGSLLSEPVSQHLLSIQTDQNIATAFGLAVLGPVLWLIALQLRNKWRAPYQFAICYLLAMVCVSGPSIADAAGVDAPALVSGLGFNAHTLANLLPEGTAEFLKVF